MSSHITFSLPFPVSVNQLYAGKGRRYLSPKAKAWIEAAALELIRMKAPRVSGQVKVLYEFQDAIDRRKRDAFNYEKILTDLLVSMQVIEADDNTILREGTVRWCEDVTGVRVTITQIGEIANVR